jgi:hypothetical protein
MALVGLLSPILLFYLWRQSRHQYRGLGLLFYHAAIPVVGLLLIVGRGTLPDVVSVTGGNACIYGGMLVGVFGLKRLFSIPQTWARDGLIFSSLLLAHWYFLVIDPHLPVRVVISLSAMAHFAGQCAWILLVQVERKHRAITRFSAVLAMLVVFACAIRAGINLTYDPDISMYEISKTDAFFSLLIQLFVIAFDFSLILMVNGLTLQGLSEREASLREERDRFEKSLQENMALRKLLPVCAWCHKIRDDKGYWSEVQEYFTTSTQVTHGVCPACTQKLFEKK